MNHLRPSPQGFMPSGGRGCDAHNIWELPQRVFLEFLTWLDVASLKVLITVFIVAIVKVTQKFSHLPQVTQLAS